jgi:tRNA(fMet)-specific endonuclease VapC
MKSYLIDTSILIDFLRQKDKSTTLLQKLAVSRAYMSISIISHTELYAGKSVWTNEKAQLDLELLLSGLRILPLTEEISCHAGKLRASYNMNLIDALIASTAITHGLPLMTLNRKHFSPINELSLVDL